MATSTPIVVLSCANWIKLCMSPMSKMLLAFLDSVLYRGLPISPFSICRETFHPRGPALDEQSKSALVTQILSEADANHDHRISFEEFVPFYRRMAEKFYMQQHGADEGPASSASVPRVRLSAAPTSPSAPPPTPQRSSTTSPTRNAPRVLASPGAMSGQKTVLAELMHESHTALLLVLDRQDSSPEDAMNAARRVLEASHHVAATVQTTVSCCCFCGS